MKKLILIAVLLLPFVLFAQNKLTYKTSEVQTLLDKSKNSQVGVFNVLDYGAVGNGIHDDTQAFKDAFLAAGSYSSIYIPAGDYLITSKVTIDQDRVVVYGRGKYASRIIFNPASADTLFKFRKFNTSVLSQCEIKDIGISSGNTITKTAIAVIDADVFNISNISVVSWTSVGKDAVGLLLKGRDQFSIRQVDFIGDRPVVFADNPMSTIDSDHFHFSDCYLNNIDYTAPNPIVEVLSGVNLTNIIFDGYQVWVGGTYGFYWNDTGTNQISYNLNLSNIRYEQGLNTTSWGVYIVHNMLLKQLSLNNIIISTNNGFYLRNATGISFKNIATWTTSSSNSALDINSTVSEVTFTNTQFDAGSLISKTGAEGLSGGYNRATLSSSYPYIDSYFIPNTANLSINPTVNGTNPFSQITSPSVIVENGDSIYIGGSQMFGYLMITEYGDGCNAIYSLGKASGLRTTEVNDICGWYTGTREVDNLGVYYNAALHKYVLRNNKGFAMTFSIVSIGYGENDIDTP